MATDSFTGGNGTSFATHDSNWTYVTGTGDYGVINSNAASLSQNNSNATYRYTGSNGNTSIITHLGGVTTGTTQATVNVRSVSTGQGYSFYLTASGGIWTGGNVTKNGGYLSGISSISIDPANDHVLKITAEGTGATVTIKCYVDDVLIKTATDSSTPLTTGESAIYLVNAASGANQAIADNWSDGDVATATALPRRALDGPFYGSLRGSVR